MFILTATTFIASAQTANTTTSTNDEGMPTRSISYGNTAVDYSDSYRVLGRRHDQLVMVGETDSTGYTPYYWKARTIDGWYGGAFAGVSYDFGNKNNCIGYAVYAKLGYTAKWFDFAVSAGYSRLGNSFTEGEKYGDWSVFFEPSLVFARWNKETELHRLYVGVMLGLQRCKSARYFFYEDDYIIIEQEGGDRAFSPAYGGKIGYQFRQYMGAVRVGVELRVYTYAAKSTFEVEGNGVQLANETNAFSRCEAQLGVTLFGVFGRSANNYASAANAAGSR